MKSIVFGFLFILLGFMLGGAYEVHRTSKQKYTESNVMITYVHGWVDGVKWAVEQPRSSVYFVRDKWKLDSIAFYNKFMK